MIKELREDLLREEGKVNHAYQDNKGFLTIGVGRLIDKRKGGGISGEEIELLLTNDIKRIVAELAQHIHFWGALSDPQRVALANMAFQMGVNGLLNFRKMLAALETKDVNAVRDEALDSVWAREFPVRAARVIEKLVAF